MSLINDVLKDLDRRDTSETAAGPRPASRHRSAPPRRNRHWPLWIIAALALGAILHLSLDGRSVTERVDPAEALTAQVDPDPAPEPPLSDSAASDQKIAHTEETSSSGDARANGRHSRVMEAAADPSTRARQSPQPNQVDEQSRDLESDPAQSGAEEATASADEPDKNPKSAPPATPVQKEYIPPATTGDAEEATISIQRAGGEQVETDALAAAKRQLARGQVQRAEAGLRQLVDEQPGLTEAHELLASTLIRRRQHAAAARVLESGLARAHEPAALAALLGRLLIERGEIARARTVLDQHAPAMSKNPDYHLLLAAAHRQAGDHERAAQHYRALAEHLPRRGAVWIGLGASLESLDRPQEAVNAYNRALNGDDDRAARFARERLAALEPLIGEPQ